MGCGVPWAIEGRFEPCCPPQTPFWAHAGQNRDLAIPWATWLNSQLRRHFPQGQPRPLVVSTPQNGPNAPLDTGELSLAVGGPPPPPPQKTPILPFVKVRPGIDRNQA